MAALMGPARFSSVVRAPPATLGSPAGHPHHPYGGLRPAAPSQRRPRRGRSQGGAAADEGVGGGGGDGGLKFIRPSDDIADPLDRVDGATHVALDRVDAVGDVLGGLGALLRQVLDLTGDTANTCRLRRAFDALTRAVGDLASAAICDLDAAGFGGLGDPQEQFRTPEAGKRAVITGGDSGIGRAVAIAIAREGADVLISYLPDEQDDARGTG